MSQAKKIAVPCHPPRVFALSRVEAERMGVELAEAKVSLRDVKSRLATMGFRRDGVSVERVLKSFGNYMTGN